MGIEIERGGFSESNEYDLSQGRKFLCLDNSQGFELDYDYGIEM